MTASPANFSTRPSRGLDLGGHRVVEAVEDGAGALRVLLAELGRADQVGEEHRRDLALLRRCHRTRLDGGSARRTEPGVSGERGGAEPTGQRAFTS